jgi:hypothetical protein
MKRDVAFDERQTDTVSDHERVVVVVQVPLWDGSVPDPTVTQTIRSRADLDALLDAISLSGGTACHLLALSLARSLIVSSHAQWALRAKHQWPPLPRPALPLRLSSRTDPHRRPDQSPTRTLKLMTLASAMAPLASASATARQSPRPTSLVTSSGGRPTRRRRRR